MAVYGKSAEQFVLRMPNGLREEIRAKASENMRSMNSEIVYLIQISLKENLENQKGEATA